MTPKETLAALWRDLGGPESALDSLRLTGADPVLPSSFRVGTAAQVSIAAAALAAAELWRSRGGAAQEVAVDMAHAAAEFRSERHLRVDDGEAANLWDAIAGIYQCGDGRWVRIHTNFPHHRDGILKLLGCANEPDAVARALKGWKAADFEEAVAQAGVIAAMMRSPEEWQAHPQGQAVATLPLISIERIGEAPPQPLPAADRPLEDVRVLDLTRIIAGPICGRALAAHGAEVMRVTAPHLPFIAPLVIDCGRGKLSAYLDLRQGEEQKTLEQLLGQADIFVQGYRPGAISGRGFSPERAAELRPGIVYVSLSAYGHAGPWAGRRGFDSIVQTASGINHQEAAAFGLDRPKALPCQALDHASGYFLALGAMIALKRRVEQGGSWHVRVALARTGKWIQDLGRISEGVEIAEPDAGQFLEQSESGFGRLTTVSHAAQLAATPARWARPAMPLGSHPAQWPG